MHIQEIEVVNFRGVNIELKNLAKDFLIIGKNDVGKSNLCYAIRKVLDFNVRRIPLTESDSTNYNKERIEFKLLLNVDGLEKNKKSIISQFIEKNGASSVLFIHLYAVYNDEIGQYDEYFELGSNDKVEKVTNRSCEIDKVLQIIYISPNYNLDRDKSSYFRNKQIREIDEAETLSKIVAEKVKELNNVISMEPKLIELQNEMNSNDGFEELFDGIVFGISSNIDLSNIYKSLDIVAQTENNKNKIIVGDGKSKTMAMLLQKMTYSDDKHKIFIVEEPENHLFPAMQKHYASLIKNLNMSQTIYTSHSPHIIDFKKMDQIIRLVKIGDNTKNFSLNIDENDYKKFGYLLNEEIAEIFFYDKVLLVEGYTEKYFYNRLFIENETFREKLLKMKMGIFCVYGIDFGPAKSILNKLGIEVWIKTDNDVFNIPYKDKKKYAGIKRVLNCLSDESIETLKEIVGVENLDEALVFNTGETESNRIEKHMEDVVLIFLKNKVILSLHNEGFERDFLEFIDMYNEANIKFLTESKMKNLHQFLEKNKVELKITSSNSNSVLLGFLDA